VKDGSGAFCFALQGKTIKAENGQPDQNTLNQVKYNRFLIVLCTKIDQQGSGVKAWMACKFYNFAKL
jgi:hypothetical protein